MNAAEHLAQELRSYIKGRKEHNTQLVNEHKDSNAAQTWIRGYEFGLKQIEEWLDYEVGVD